MIIDFRSTGDQAAFAAARLPCTLDVGTHLEYRYMHEFVDLASYV